MSDYIKWAFGGFSTDVAEQMAFYGAYHQNKVNQLIHAIFVPLIWWSACVWFAYSPKLFKRAPYWMNWSFVLYLGYAGFYAALDWETSILVNTVYFGLFMLANWLVQRERKQGASGKPKASKGSAAKIALVIHLLSWYMQIHPGHAVFEGRKPALLDSLLQALTLAPMFVFYEVIWFFFPGFKPELKKAVDDMIAKKNAEWGK